MTRIVLIVIALLYGCITAQGITITNQDKYYYLCKIWGYSKYFNTEDLTRMQDYDTRLLDILNRLDTVNDLEEYNLILRNIITIDEKDFYIKKQNIERIKIQYNNQDNINIQKDIYQGNVLDIEWIINNDVLSKELQDILIYSKIYGKYKNRKHVKVGLTGIKENYSLHIPALKMKWEHFMLGYFTYWNIVAYYFPYKKYMKTSWDSVLNKMITEIYQTNSLQDYTYTLKRMNAHLDDSHAGVGFPKGIHESHFGYTSQSHWFPARFTFLKDTLVVIAVYSGKNQSLTSELKVGDIITHINDEPVNKLKLEIVQYNSSSNEAWKDKIAGNYLTNGYLSIKDSIIQLKILRNQMEKNITIKKELTLAESIAMHGYEPSINKTSCMYMDFSQGARALRPKFRHLNDSCCWIIDLRNHTSSFAGMRLAKYLRKKPQPVARFSYPSKKEPGIFKKYNHSLSFYYSNQIDFLLKAFFPAIQAKIFPNFRTDTFSGKIFVIIGTSNRSYDETIAMILKSYRIDATFIGTNTNGTNGNVASIEIPGGIEVFFSGIDFHFASGERLQGIGIQPDILTPLNVSTIQANRDYIIDKVNEVCGCK